MPRSLIKVVGAALIVLQWSTIAGADALTAGTAAFQRGDYIRAARQLLNPSLRGNARAEGLLGYMYTYGLGVPQSYPLALELLSRAAERGNPTAQQFLGLMYDKGLGVLPDYVIAYKWLNLAAAGASRREREHYVRLRDAVASKLTPAQLAEGQWLAMSWVAGSRF